MTIDKLIAHLFKENEEQKAVITQLTDADVQLTANAEEQKNKNSHNSSKPLSSDGLKKPPANTRRPSGKNAGAQEGYKVSSLLMAKEPDTVVEHIPIYHPPHYTLRVNIARIGTNAKGLPVQLRPATL
ncbi:MAG: DUF6444 domain-containing protein [Clostridia bacterium]|nr:DUF6444 domain-containing protein [Clostridia bacterium]